MANPKLLFGIAPVKVSSKVGDLYIYKAPLGDRMTAQRLFSASINAALNSRVQVTALAAPQVAPQIVEADINPTLSSTSSNKTSP